MTDVVLTGDGITAFHMLAQYHALKLEIAGLKHSSGRSVYKHIVNTYGFKGTRPAVLNQFKLLLIERGYLKGDI